MTTNPRTLSSLTKETKRNAGRASIAETLASLAGIEESLREEARLKFQLGLDPTILLTKAAHIGEARFLIEEHALPQD
jgi:hypothetical protein